MGSTTLEPHVRRSSPDLTPGTLVGDYRIDSTIGTGGMGAVYQATQPVIGKRVAIKLLHRSKSQIAVNRFVKEARAVNLIGHPNIVDVFGFGMTGDGRAYLVMELLVGETLAVRAKRGAMSLAELSEILIEVTHALEAAHEANVIHRDLKPENIFLAKRKGALNVKLLDFGIAKLIGDGEPGMTDDTRPGVLIGTPRYISPEQVRGKVLDGGADIYALGVVAFELMAGRPPFTATDSYELFEKHAKLKPPKPSAFNAELPEAADALVSGMLAKEPGERPSLAAIRDALVALQATPAATIAGTRTAAAVEPTDVHAVVPAITTTVSDRRPEAASGLRRLILPAMLVTAASAGIALALAFTGGSGIRERIAPLPTVVAPTQPAFAGEPALDPPADQARARASGDHPHTVADHPHTAGDHARSDEPEIEMEPIATGSSAHGGPRHPTAVHGKHDHAHGTPEVRPASEPTTARPNDKPSSATHADEGDDAVRSPFEHAP